MQSQGHPLVGRNADIFGHQWHQNIAQIQT